MKTMNDLFILDIMEQCEVIAGASGLNRYVRNVNISDTPDAIKYLEKNQLLLTTGYGFVDDTKKLSNLIVEMDKLDCAGIIIKIDRFIKELPEEIITLAEKLSFPILNTPNSHNLGNMSRHILNYLNDDEAEQLYYALHVQKEFSKMMLEEYSVEALITQLSLYIDRPVIFLNHRAEEKMISNFPKDGALIKMKKTIIKIIKSNIQAARSGFSYIQKTNGLVAFTTFPIITKNMHPSILVILDASTLPYPSSQMAIEQASNVISFTIIKAEAVNENLQSLKNNFFSDLIEKNDLTRKDIATQVNYYGLDMEATSICIACTIDAQGGHQREGVQLYEKRVGVYHNHIFNQLEDTIIDYKLKATTFTKGIYFITIVQLPVYSDKEISEITAFIKDVQNLDEAFTLSFGVSSAIQDLEDLGIAYEEAIDAIKQGYSLYNKEFIYFYKTKELKELLGTIPIKDLRALYENTLKSLAYPSDGDTRELVKTMEVYLEHQCEITNTAKALYVHRNTVKYRIKKAEDTLGESLKDPTNSLRIRVALLIGQVINK